MLDDNCIFCKIAAGEIPSETVYEDEQFRAILDLGPASAGHTLILPKAHFKDVTEISDEYAANVLKVAAKLGKAHGWWQVHNIYGYRIEVQRCAVISKTSECEGRERMYKKTTVRR